MPEARTPWPPPFVPREECAVCGRPRVVCYCDHVRPIQTRNRVVILQHPRERDMPIGTARMAHLCLADSVLATGVDWEGTGTLAAALGDAGRPPVLLYPGPAAVDIARAAPPGPVTVIAIDGTWRQAKKIVNANPVLQTLPRYTFVPPAPSDYRIRKEPKAEYVSTIEALAHVLGVLEGDPERFQAMLAPFRAMVDAQIAHEVRMRPMGSRHRRRLRARPAGRPRVPDLLLERASDLVCVAGEANAWPRRRVATPMPYADELIHWTAHRPATGETFDMVVAPRNPLSPSISGYVGVPAPEILAGESIEAVLARWRTFARDTDVVCAWGTYATTLFAALGAPLPAPILDVRHTARVYRSKRFGVVHEFLAGAGVDPGPPLARGRAGERLRALVTVVELLQAALTAK